MKQGLTLLTFLFSFHCFSQFELEMSYDNYEINRFNFEQHGEKYTLYNNENQTIEIYDENHELWKSIQLTVPNLVEVYKNISISQHLLNEDDLLEIIYFVSIENIDGTYSFETRIIDENENLILSVPYGENRVSAYINPENVPRIDKTPGLAPKVFIHTVDQTQLFNVKPLSFEYTYPLKPLFRVNLDVDGEKYFHPDYSTSKIIFFRSNHIVWKITSIPSWFSDIKHISQQLILNDPQIEIIGFGTQSLNGEQQPCCAVIDENGFTLLQEQYVKDFELSQLEDYKPKLIFHIKNQLHAFSKVFSCSTLQHEKTYPYQTSRIQLSSLGETYFFTKPETNQIHLFNKNHCLIKKISLNIPLTKFVNVFHISQTLINDDLDIEILYNVSDGFELSDGYLVKENGEVLLYIPGANILKMDICSGLLPKVIAHGLPSEFGTKVFGLHKDFTSLREFGKYNLAEANVYPNPFNSYVKIDFKSSNHPSSINVLSPTGELIQVFDNLTMTNQLNLNTLSSGLYFLDLDSKNKGKYLQIVKHQ